jgi:hypothetical protein
MDCDRVFAVLTRGPFPTGDSPADQALESHLLVCASCRRLAEALRPVEDRNPEAVTSEESRQLPGYWGRLQGTAIDQALSCIDPHDRATPPAEASVTATPAVQRFGRLKLWRFAAAVALGIGLGAVLRFWDNAAELTGRGTAARPVPPAPAYAEQRDAPAAPKATSRELLAALPRPVACLTEARFRAARRHANDAGGLESGEPLAPPSPAGRLKALGTDVEACCTQCHHAGKAESMSVAGAHTVRRSCALCHGDAAASTLGP